MLGWVIRLAKSSVILGSSKEVAALTFTLPQQNMIYMVIDDIEARDEDS